MQQEQTFVVRADASRAEELAALLKAHGFELAPAAPTEQPTYLALSHFAQAVSIGYAAHTGRSLERDTAQACAKQVLEAAKLVGVNESLAQAQQLRYAVRALQVIATGVPMPGKYAESAVKHVCGPQPAIVHVEKEEGLSRVGKDLDHIPQPYVGAIVLLETIAGCGAKAFEEDGSPTPNRRLCLQFAEQMRVVFAKPLTIGSTPILSWQQRYEAERSYWGAHDERSYMQAEIDQLRLVLSMYQPFESSADPALDAVAQGYLALMKPRANKVDTGVHLWTGWALVDAFKAGRQSAYNS